MNRADNNIRFSGVFYLNVFLYILFLGLIINGFVQNKDELSLDSNIAFNAAYAALMAVVLWVCYGLLLKRKWVISWAISINCTIAFLVIGLKPISYIVLLGSVDDFSYREYFDGETIVLLLFGIVLIVLSLYYKFKL